MQDNFQKLMFLFSVIFFVATLGALIFSQRFLNNKIKSIEESQVTWHTEAVRREEITILDDTLRALKEERAELESHFTRKSDVVPLLDTLESLAEAVSAKATISSVEVSKDNTSLVIILKTIGTFDSLYKFLVLLENAPYQIDFSMVDFRKTPLSSEGELAATPIWEGVFGLKVLSFIPQ